MKKRLSIVLACGVILGTIFSCVNAFALETIPATDTIKIDSENNAINKGKRILGKVTAVNGNKITLVTANIPQMSENPNSPPPQSKGERPERTDDKKPEMKETEFTGEEITITIDNESILKTRNRKFKDTSSDTSTDTSTEINNEIDSASISDIKAGSILNILYSSDDGNEEIKEIMLRTYNNSISTAE